MKNFFKACCFTGYRPHKFSFKLNSKSQKYVLMENKLYDAVFSLPEQGCFRFYCGMASGFDIIADETVVALKKLIKSCRVDLIAVIPFKSQSESFEESWKERYNNLLKKADYLVNISDEYTKFCYSR